MHDTLNTIFWSSDNPVIFSMYSCPYTVIINLLHWVDSFDAHLLFIGLIE